jgi:serine/threonine protein kinase
MISCADIEVMISKTKYETFDFVYRAPESFVKYNKYYLTNDKSDIWALGIAFLYFYLNKELYVFKHSKKYMSEESFEKINFLFKNKVDIESIHDEIIVESIKYQQEKLFRGNIFDRYIKILSITNNEYLSRLLTRMLDFNIEERFSIIDVYDYFFNSTKCPYVSKFNIINTLKPVKWDKKKSLAIYLALSKNKEILLDVPIEALFVSFDVICRTLSGLDFDDSKLLNYITLSALNVAMNLYDISFNCVGKRCLELELCIVNYLKCIIRRLDYLYLPIDNIESTFKRYIAYNEFINIMFNLGNISDEFKKSYLMIDTVSFISKFFIHDKKIKDLDSRDKVLSLLDPPKTMRQLNELIKLDVYTIEIPEDENHKYIDFNGIDYKQLSFIKE